MTPTSHSSRPWTGLKHALVVVALLLSATNSPAGRMPEEWDDLPDIDSISFSETSVGLTTPGGDHYLLDRSTSRVQEFSKQQFEQYFAGSIGAKVAEVTKETGIESMVLLRTSNGTELTTQNAYCDEGGSKHALRMNGTSVKDHVNPCTSVSCAEIVGDNLWLGTRYDGEYGDYPAEGILVQTLDQSLLVKKLSTKEGLTGDLIRAIRFDPFEKTVWVATNEGLNVVGQDYRIQETLFLYRELDPDSGIPLVRLSTTKQKSDPMVMVYKRLQTSDATQFYAVTSSTPAAAREHFTRQMLGGRHGSRDERSVGEAFAPKEMNVLVPLYLEDARSSDERVQQAALSNMCLFNDQRVIDFMVEQRKLPPAPEWTLNLRLIQGCLDKFTKFGLMNAQQLGDQIATMLEQERAALERIRGATFKSAYPDIKVVVKLAADLKKAGNPQGIELINEYFRAMDGTRDARTSDEVFAQMSRDRSFFEWIGTNLAGEDLSPAMLDGVRKFWFPSTLRTGCSYFDMRHPGKTRRFDVQYAEATLAAIGRTPPGGAPPPPDSKDYCVEAFKSQLGNSDVREAFFKDVYPQLTLQQKELADKLSKEALAPLDPYD